MLGSSKYERPYFLLLNSLAHLQCWIKNSGYFCLASLLSGKRVTCLWLKRKEMNGFAEYFLSQVLEVVYITFTQNLLVSVGSFGPQYN